MDAEEDRKSKDLVRRYQGGDTAALGELFEMHNKPLLAFVRKWIGWQDHQRIEDVAQKVWENLIDDARTYRETDTQFTTWLLTIARNRCRDALRTDKRRRTRVGELEEPEHVAEAAPSVPELTEDAMRLKEIERALLKLPSDQRAAFLLRCISGKTDEEVAAEVGAPVSTVKKRIKGAIDKVRAILGVRPE
jgi:RNA polymerase sigma-70 factor (ECF subfamily)